MRAPVAEPVAAGGATVRAPASTPAARSANASSTGPQAPAPRPAPLDTVPRPPEGATVVPLDVPAGGLTARHATWRTDGGEVLLTGTVPFVDLTARAGFRSDGTLDGTLDLRGAVRLFGLTLAEVSWQQSGWTPDATLVAPAVALHGTRLTVDLTPVGPQAVLTPGAGIAADGDGPVRSLELPGDAVPQGLPLDPGRVELFAALRGWDASGLRVHPDAPVGGAPAFVSDHELFFAPGRYGPDSPEALALLDAAIKAALTGLVGAVAPAEPAPPPAPDPADGTPPQAATDPVPADVAPVPEPVAPAPPEATPDGAAEPGAGPEAATAAPTADAGGGAAGAEATAAEATPPPAEVEVELVMPPAPSTPGPAAQARMGGVGGGARAAATAARDLPPADADVADARGAVTEPVAETAARAQEGLAAALGERPAPSPEIVELCDRIRTAIREHRPVDEDELLATDPTHEAQAAGATVSGSVEGQVDEVNQGYADMSSPPAGSPALTPTPVEPPPAGSPGMGVAASTAAPDPIPPENLSLDGDVAATDQRIADAGVDTRVTQEIPDAPFATVRDGRSELGEMAEQTPAELAAQQTQAIEAAQGDMADLQARATQALQAARTGAVGAVATGQTAATGSEELTRDQAGQRAQQIFDTAQQQVTGLLEPLSRTAMARWESGLARTSQEFHDALDRVQRWIDDRHSGVGGYVVAVGDAVFGLPDWVIEEYDRAERAFGDGVCDLLLDISTEVNGVVAAAQALIAQARTDIETVFTALEEQFPEFVAEQRAKFGGMLDGLAQQATDTQTGFVRDVSRRATEAVAEAQAAVEERREAARGVIGRVVAAIEAFIDDPVTAIINGLLTLVGIPPAAFWALVARIQQVVADIANDPETFVNNLVAGLKQGFQQFFDNFGTHVLHGFWDWLFSGLEVPIPMPTDLSAGSLFSFALQLMGITWAKVREILVRHVGEQNVAIIEAAWQVIQVLIEQGPQGLVDMIKERLTPETIVQTILEAAVQYLIETLIQQVVVRVIGMLNPVGAIAQAIDLIYQVLSWVFRNAARIFRFVEAVVNGIANVMAGNISGMAQMVEQSLATLIPPVIDFLAGLLHLGGLPGEIADVIVRLQTTVYQVLDLIIGTLAERGRALLASLGLGGEDDGQHGGEDDELGTTVRFSGGGEAHRLFVQTAGSDATLMVASVPTPIENKIAEWQGMLAAGQPADEAARAEATTTLGNLRTIAGEASAEGDRLAVLFLQAQADGPDGTEPPSDDALENRERAIAGILARLFELFGQQDEAEWLRKITAAMPGHAATRAADLTQGWARRLAEVTYLPTDATRAKPIWDPAALAAAARPAGDAVARSGAHHTTLLGWYTSGVQRRAEPSSPSFYDFALVQRSPNPSHDVRRQFTDALGDAYAAAMRSALPTDLDPVDTALETAIGQVAFDGGVQPNGAMAPLPNAGTGTDPALITAVGSAGGIIAFLRSMVLSQQAAGYRWARLSWAWDQPASHDWLAGQLRGADPGQHEWIPTSEVRNLVDHAIQQRALHPGDLSRSVGWVQFFHTLRSATPDVSYVIRSGPTLPSDPRESRTPVTDAGIGSHSGGQYADETGNRGRGLIGQSQFHDWLRSVYYQMRDAGPVAFGQSLISRLGYEVWDGTLTEAMAPRAVWFQPLDLWFTVEGGGRVHGLTLAELAVRQREAWQRIESDFTRALYSVDA